MIPGAGDDRPPAQQLAGWLLDGRFLTLDSAGAITTWSAAAQRAFGWTRKDVVGSPFADALIADGDRSRAAEVLRKLLEGDCSVAGPAGDFDAVTADGHPLRAAFATVPIHIAIGYEFNGLLQSVSGGQGGGSRAEAKSREESVVALLEGALSGAHAASAESDDGRRLAGALVLFSAEPAPQVDNVVPIAEAASAEEARSQRDGEEAEALRAGLEEARQELQRARNDADVARQEASDARDALAAAQHQSEAADRALAEGRHSAEESAAAAEKLRIEMEEARREAERLRNELLETRDEARAAHERIEAELNRTRQNAEEASRDLTATNAELGEARRDLADARRELARHTAELEAARAHAEAVQAELTGVHAEAGELRARAERAERELEQAAAAASGMSEELEALRGTAPSEIDPAEIARLRARLERVETVLDRAPVGAILTAPDGRILEVNRALCDALGHSRAALVGDDPPALVHADDVDAKRELARRLMRGEQVSARGFRRYVHADGHTLTMRESVSLVRDAEGEPAMFVVQLEEAPADEPVEQLIVDADVAVDERDGSDEPSYALMRKAIEDELFVMHCQPVLDLQSNTVGQHELLLRMVGDDGRLILPQVFLETARRAGLAGAIDRWVIRRAFALLAQDPQGDSSLEINLSPEAMYDPSVAELIESQLAETLVDPARVIFEVTSQTAVEDLDAAKSFAKRLRSLGCRFALDDFHSTFGSLRVLKELPIDYLKLDGDLVSSLGESRTSQLIVRAIVEVATGTGTKTVAVFVSDEDLLRLLRQQGVDYAQGYAVGRPKPVEEIWPAHPALPSGA